MLNVSLVAQGFLTTTTVVVAGFPCTVREVVGVCRKLGRSWRARSRFFIVSGVQFCSDVCNLADVGSRFQFLVVAQTVWDPKNC
jgi:hypothetical protein